MTIEEKRKALVSHCADRPACPTCALFSWEDITTCDFSKISPTGLSDDLIEKAYDMVFHSKVYHPGHYNREGAMECIDEMVLIFGKQAVMHFCLCNAWKYRYRAADKNGVEDLKKSDWYLAKYNELIGGDEK